MFSLVTVFVVDPPAYCFQLLLERSRVDSLESIRFLILNPAAISTSFLSSACPGLTRDPKLCDEISHHN